MSVWAGRNTASAARLAATVFMVAAGPCAAWGQGPADSLEGFPIRRVDILARNIYDPLPAGRLKPFYELANALHVRTRDRTIRDPLLLRPGDPWSAARAHESERALRALGILEPFGLEATPAGDSVDVVLETRDDWTTQPEFAIQSADGQSFMNVALTERNLMGRGKGVSLTYREAPEGITRDAEYRDPNVFGSRMRFTAHGGSGSEGASQGVEAGVPFYAERAPYAYGVRWNLVTSVAHLYQAAEEAAAFDRRIEETEVFWGRGLARGSTIVRLTGSFLARDRRFGASRLAPGAPEEFGGGEENVHERRWSVEIRWWRPAFVELEGIDRLGGIEDLDLGTSARLIAGLSPRLLGGTADEGYLATRLETGGRAGAHSFAVGGIEFKTRLEPEPVETIGRLRARWVSQLRRDHTLVLAGYGATAYRPERDFQEILGGLSGLRALPVRGLAGQQAWRFNAEHRWWAGHDFFQLVSLGTAAFYDLGRTWGPGAVGEHWRQDVGFGLRLALPRSGQDRVARLDIAWSVTRRPGEERGPVISLGSGQAF